jgi:hypothetical protein
MLEGAKAANNFRKLVKRVTGVPKSKIDAREVKYRNGRKNKNRRRHRRLAVLAAAASFDNPRKGLGECPNLSRRSSIS